MKSIHTLRKVSLATLLTFVLSFSSVFAQNDTIYIMKSGVIVSQYNVNTEVDSVIFYKPPTSGTFTDPRDGKVYNWVQIGNQVWMAENLAYLPSVNMVADGSENAAGSYYYVYGYDGTNVTDAKATANYNTYGVLYNWTAAMDGEASSTTNPSGIQGVCPTGWHLPSDAEWTELTDYLGTDAGSKLAGNAIFWINGTLDQNANFGETGFSALPGGLRYYDGTFLNIGDNCYWWSATENDALSALLRGMNYNYVNVYRLYNLKELGVSVRCIRD